MHKIHLKGPWLYEWLEKSAPDSSNDPRDNSGTVKMPGAWQQHFGPATGKVQFRRRFHWLADLAEDEIVELVFNGVNATGTVAVNEERLGELAASQQPVRFDITTLLQETNWLIVDLEYRHTSEESPGGLWAPVTLEITEPQPAS